MSINYRSVGAGAASLIVVAGAAAAWGQTRPAPEVWTEVGGQAARQMAAAKGLPVRTHGARGEVSEIDRFVNGHPLYKTTLSNVIAADTISSDNVWLGGVAGMNLRGNGVRVAIWDSGSVRSTHREWAGRVALKNAAAPASDHATHVAGTIIAAGIRPAVKGHAYAASLDSYDWNDVKAEMLAATVPGSWIFAGNHSWGFSTGWEGVISGRRVWLGDTTVSLVEDYRFGFYDSSARDFDDVCVQRPFFLPVVAAGNDRNDAPPPAGTPFWVIRGGRLSEPWFPIPLADGGDTGFDTISGHAVGKNVLTVGAVNDIVGGWAAPAGVVPASFSSYGPTDDGRIKPDVVANGVGLESCGSLSDADYYTNSGTSMSSPSATGALAQLWQYCQDVRYTPSAATMKALIIGTADEAGVAAGPDYRMGWGLINTQRAATALRDAFAVPARTSIYEGFINRGEPVQRFRLIPTDGPIRVTMVYPDRPGLVFPPALDRSTRQLVNDLDIVVAARSSFFGATSLIYPWVLNPALPAVAAVRGNNDLDNVERIDFSRIVATSYTLSVAIDGVFTDYPGGGAGLQPYSIVVTGARLERLPGGIAPPVGSGQNPGVGLAGDLDGDGEIAFADLLEYLNLYNASDPQADLDLDGEVTPGDLAVMLTAING